MLNPSYGSSAFGLWSRLEFWRGPWGVLPQSRNESDREVFSIGGAGPGGEHDGQRIRITTTRPRRDGSKRADTPNPNPVSFVAHHVQLRKEHPKRVAEGFRRSLR